jgi:hypothetical protein
MSTKGDNVKAQGGRNLNEKRFAKKAFNHFMFCPKKQKTENPQFKEMAAFIKCMMII